VSVFTGRPPQVSDHPGYVPGLHYGPQVGATANTAIAANTLYAMPIQIRHTVVVSGLVARFNTGAVGAGKLGIYQNDRGVPTALLAECSAALDTALTTAQTTGFAANPVLSPGWYWFCMCCNSAPSPFMGANTAGSMFGPLIGSPTAGAVVLGATSMTQRLTGPLTYAGPGAFFPAAFPAITRGTGSPGTPLMEFVVAA
jgi:hypothetical protein